MGGNDGIGMGFSFNFDTTDGTRERPKDAPKAGEARLQPAGAGQQEYAAPPLRILALADFCGLPERRRPQRVVFDRDEPDAGFAALRASLFLTVSDRLRGDPKGLEVRLQPRRLSDLEPAAVAAAIPECELACKFLAGIDAVQQGRLAPAELRAALALYEEVPALGAAIRAAQQGLSSAASAASAGEPTPAKPAPAKSAPRSGGDLDALLALVDAPVEEEAPAAPPPSPSPAAPAGRSAIGSAISAIGGAAPRAGGGPDLSAARRAVEQVLAAQVAEVMHDPQFRRVEAAWRGLSLLVRRAPRRAVIVEALDAAPDAMAEVFEEEVVGPESGGRGESPLSLVVADVALGNSSAELGLLERLAQGAEAIQCALVVSLAPDFCGVPAERLAGLSNPRALFDKGYAEWQGMRKADATRWVAAAYNRILLREPHTGRRGGLPEPVTGREELLWGNAGWGLALLAAASVERTGWPANLSGARDGRVEDLPLWAPEGGEAAGPLEVALSEDCVEDLAEQGIAALTPQAGSDVALALRAPTLRRPEAGEPRFHAHLGYQLLAARLGETLLAYKARLAGGSPEETLGRIQAFVNALVGDTGPGAGAAVEGMADPETGGMMVGVTARTGRGVLGGVEVHLGVTVPLR